MAHGRDARVSTLSAEHPLRMSLLPLSQRPRPGGTPEASPGLLPDLGVAFRWF